MNVVTAKDDDGANLLEHARATMVFANLGEDETGAVDVDGRHDETRRGDERVVHDAVRDSTSCLGQSVSPVDDPAPDRGFRVRLVSPVRTERRDSAPRRQGMENATMKVTHHESEVYCR